MTLHINKKWLAWISISFYIYFVLLMYIWNILPTNLLRHVPLQNVDFTRKEINTSMTSYHIQRNVIGQNQTHDVKRNHSFEHKLAVIIPFRNCQKELTIFAPYLHNFLSEQGISYKMYVINQVDRYRFNRASLINVGYREMDNTCDYLAIHDVDLLPLNRNLSYRYPDKGPFHLTSNKLHPYIRYTNYLGGILLMTKSHFEMINGMSNLFWGWGGEDDELFLRIKQNNFKIQRPVGIKTGRRSFLHIHDLSERPRDKQKNSHPAKLKYSNQSNRVTGLNSVMYNIESRNETKVKWAKVTFINVRLHCDVNETPFCLAGNFISNRNTNIRRNINGKPNGKFNITNAK